MYIQVTKSKISNFTSSYEGGRGLRESVEWIVK